MAVTAWYCLGLEAERGLSSLVLGWESSGKFQACWPREGKQLVEKGDNPVLHCCQESYKAVLRRSTGAELDMKDTVSFFAKSEFSLFFSKYQNRDNDSQ